MILTEPIKVTLTTSSGSASNTYSFVAGSQNTRRIVQLTIKPTTSDTGYDFKITDKFSIDIFEETGFVGTYSSTNPDNISQYIYGNFTLSISNATNDEAIEVLMVFLEEL